MEKAIDLSPFGSEHERSPALFGLYIQAYFAAQQRLDFLGISSPRGRYNLFVGITTAAGKKSNQPGEKHNGAKTNSHIYLHCVEQR